MHEIIEAIFVNDIRSIGDRITEFNEDKMGVRYFHYTFELERQKGTLWNIYCRAVFTEKPVGTIKLRKTDDKIFFRARCFASIWLLPLTSYINDLYKFLYHSKLLYSQQNRIRHKRESDHHAFPKEKREAIVIEYRKLRMEGRIISKHKWAKANYQISGRTLLEYEREFPEKRAEE